MNPPDAVRAAEKALDGHRPCCDDTSGGHELRCSACYDSLLEEARGE